MEIPANNPESNEDNQPSTGLKIGVLIALIVLLIVGILLPIKLVPNAFSSFGSTFSSWFGKKTTITLSTDKSEIDSGIPFTLSWTGDHQTGGSYVISYACTNGVHFETSVNQPNETIGCDTQYYFLSTQNSVLLTPFSTANQSAEVILSLGFLQNGASQPQNLGQITLNIINNSIVGTTTATSTSQTNSSTSATTSTTTEIQSTSNSSSESSAPILTQTHHTSNPNGIADLSTSIISVGYLDPTTSQFIPSHYVYSNQRAAVKFVIKNIGTKNTGAWNFTAMLPSQTNPSYTSSIQQNLGPGDSIQYTLGFDNINPNQNNTVSITADPDGSIRESSKANNTATANITNLQGSSYVPSGINTYQPDLTVTILSVGTLDQNTNTFYPLANGQYFNPNDRVGVQFKVTNIGGGTSQQWEFGATLPSLVQDQQYLSNFQTPLGPGQSTVITIGFDNLANPGPNTFTVQIDPNNQIGETNKYNNTASITLYRY